MRLAMACVMVGMAIGATIELAFAHWRDGGAALAPAVGSIDQGLMAERGAISAMLVLPVASARPSASAADADDLTAARPQGLCKEAGAKDLAAAFLNPTCGSDKAHARRGARTTYRVATVVVGRTDSPPAPATAEPTPVAAPSIEPSHGASTSAQ